MANMKDSSHNHEQEKFRHIRQVMNGQLEMKGSIELYHRVRAEQIKNDPHNNQD
jgi:hypothetical protein